MVNGTKGPSRAAKIKERMRARERRPCHGCAARIGENRAKSKKRRSVVLGRPAKSVIGKDNLGKRKFCVNEFKHLTADLMHRDVEDLTDCLQLGKLVRRCCEQHFVQFLSGVFHFRAKRIKSDSAEKT
jgi:hypothetical protein